MQRHINRVIRDEALDALRAHADEGKAAEAAAYHKSTRLHLGVPNPILNDLTTTWRQSMNVAERVALADELWQTDIFEARIAAAKLLTQARMRPDDGAWALICSWVPQFDGWAIADHACSSGSRRLVAEPERVAELEGWTVDPNLWVRRAALVMTLPWAKQNFPSDQDLAVREQVLGWAAGYVDDREWFIQKAIGWWLRDLSKHDAERVRQFLAEHGARLKPFARKEAEKYL